MAGFRGQIAVVTGASSGVGRAIATGLAVEGMALCLVGRDPERLESVAASARTNGAPVQYCAADLACDDDLNDLCARLQRDYRSLDVLVHSAGAIALGTAAGASIGDLDHQYRVNVRAPYLLTQRLLPALKSRRGQIVFINSTVGVAAKGGVGQYAATKHALKAVADSLRDEVNGEGVRVLSIFLGRTATPMQEAVHRMEGRAYTPDLLVQPQDVASVVLHALGLPRTAEVTEISIRPLRKPAG